MGRSFPREHHLIMHLYFTSKSLQYRAMCSISDGLGARVSRRWRDSIPFRSTNNDPARVLTDSSDPSQKTHPTSHAHASPPHRTGDQRKATSGVRKLQNASHGQLMPHLRRRSLPAIPPTDMASRHLLSNEVGLLAATAWAHGVESNCDMIGYSVVGARNVPGFRLLVGRASVVS